MHKLPLLGAPPVPAQAFSANPRRTKTKTACPLMAAALPGHRCWPHTTLRLPTRQGPLTQASSQKGTHRPALQAAREAGHAGLWAASLRPWASAASDTTLGRERAPLPAGWSARACQGGIQFLAVELHSETPMHIRASYHILKRQFLLG